MLGITINKRIAHHYSLALFFIITGLMYSGADYAAEKQHKTGKSHRQQKRLKINPVTDNEDAWTANTEADIYRAGTIQNIVVGYSAMHGWDFTYR